MHNIRFAQMKTLSRIVMLEIVINLASLPAFAGKDDSAPSIHNATTKSSASATTTSSSSDEAASIRVSDIESATELLLQGKWLYQNDEVKLGGYEYCGQSVALANKGELRRSIREASKALYLGKQGNDRRMRGYAYRDLAYAYSLAGNLYWAEEYAEKAVKDSYGNSKVKGPANKVLGDVALRQDRPKDALKFYKRALSAIGDRNGAISASIANAYLSMGIIDKAKSLFQKALRQGAGSLAQKGLADAAFADAQYRESEQLYAKSIRLAGDDHEYHEMWAHAGVGKARKAQGATSGAISSYLNAIDLADHVRARFRSEEFKTGFFSDTQTIFNETIDLLMATSRTDEAFEVSERSRARALLDMIRNRVVASQGIEAFADAQDRTAGIAELTKILPSDSIIASYHVTDTAVYAWVIRKDGISSIKLDGGPVDISRQSRKFRESIRLQDPSANDQARALFDILVRPLGIRAYKSIVFVPHGPLHYVPFQALHDGNNYLIERHALQYAPSASVFSSLLKRKANETLRLLALGNPHVRARDRTSRSTHHIGHDQWGSIV